MDLFSPDYLRNPYPLYTQMREASPVFREPASGLWLVFRYDDVKRVLTDNQAFSSRAGSLEWMIFQDPPRHSRMRALIAQAFTPGSIEALEEGIRTLTRELLDAELQGGEMDFAADFAVPLPMRVIGTMLGLPPEDAHLFERWNDVMLRMSYTIPGVAGAEGVAGEFVLITGEMNDYLSGLLDARRNSPRNDLLTRLLNAELEGERLSQSEILGFFQLLLLAGSETTTNLLNNAIISLCENVGEFATLRQSPDELIPSTIEEVLRYRSPLQWMFRVTREAVDLSGQTIPAGAVVLAMIGSANRDPRQFANPEHFEISRDPNPHIAFGHGAHFCLGSSLARLEAHVVLGELLARTESIELASDLPWEPRPGVHVHGPTSLPIRFTQRQSPGSR